MYFIFEFWSFVSDMLNSLSDTGSTALPQRLMETVFGKNNTKAKFYLLLERDGAKRSPKIQ